MNETPPPAEVAPRAPHERVAVWDGPVRVVHWSMVLLFVLLVVTGLRGGDALPWHMGYIRIAFNRNVIRCRLRLRIFGINH